MYEMETFVEMGFVSLESHRTRFFLASSFIFYRKKGHKWNEDHDFQTHRLFFLHSTSSGFPFSTTLLSIPKSTDGFLNISNCARFPFFLFSSLEIFHLCFFLVYSLKFRSIFQVFIWFLYFMQKKHTHTFCVFNTQCVVNLKMQHFSGKKSVKMTYKKTEWAVEQKQWQKADT